MKFPKLNMKGLLKAPSSIVPESYNPPAVKLVKTPMAKFKGIEKRLAGAKNNMKKFKV